MYPLSVLHVATKRFERVAIDAKQLIGTAAQNYKKGKVAKKATQLL
jgi:hypothetical protein